MFHASNVFDCIIHYQNTFNKDQNKQQDNSPNSQLSLLRILLLDRVGSLGPWFLRLASDREMKSDTAKDTFMQNYYRESSELKAHQIQKVSEWKSEGKKETTLQIH